MSPCLLQVLFYSKLIPMVIFTPVLMYFSHTFLLAKCNYDIYDHELLAVILTLTEWQQYIQGMSHPVTIIYLISRTLTNYPGNRLVGLSSFRILILSGRSFLV